MGDTVGHDSLCGRFASYSCLVEFQCRQCDTPTDELDNPFYDYQYILSDNIRKMVVENELVQLQKNVIIQLTIVFTQTFSFVLYHVV